MPQSQYLVCDGSHCLHEISVIFFKKTKSHHNCVERSNISHFFAAVEHRYRENREMLKYLPIDVTHSEEVMKEVLHQTKDTPLAPPFP